MESCEREYDEHTAIKIGRLIQYLLEPKYSQKF